MEKLTFRAPGQWEPSCETPSDSQWQIDAINEGEGNLKGVDCPKCKNKGFIAFLRDGNICCRDCSCMDARRSLIQMEKSGLKEIIRQMTFEAYRADVSWQKALKAGALSYAQDPTGWLLIGGQSGCGKTHLCTAVCRELLLKGYQVHYTSWRETAARLRALAYDGDAREKELDKMKKAQVLYVDDLYKTGRSLEGKDTPTGADISLAFEIINHRYINRLTTILSTERTPQELVAIDEATGSRIIELCGHHVYSVSRDQSRNYRLRSVVNL